jgi:hypothetical protein
VATQLQTQTGRGLPVEATLRFLTVKENFPYQNGWFWGSDADFSPSTMLVSVDLQVGKERILIPFSSYADLAMVKSALLETTPNGFDLRIHGGEGAASYDAILDFEGRHLQSRTVTLREFPKQRWETTRYSFIHSSN